MCHHYMCLDLNCVDGTEKDSATIQGFLEYQQAAYLSIFLKALLQSILKGDVTLTIICQLDRDYNLPGDHLLSSFPRKKSRIHRPWASPTHLLYNDYIINYLSHKKAYIYGWKKKNYFHNREAAILLSCMRCMWWVSCLLSLQMETNRI